MGFTKFILCKFCCAWVCCTFWAAIGAVVPYIGFINVGVMTTNGAYCLGGGATGFENPRISSSNNELACFLPTA